MLKSNGGCCAALLLEKKQCTEVCIEYIFQTNSEVHQVSIKEEQYVCIQRPLAVIDLPPRK